MDNDPIVLVHARALLATRREGRTAYLDADLRDPAGILAAEELRGTLDLSKPVAVTLIGVLQHLVDDAAVTGIVATLMAPLAPGSVLALSVLTADSNPESVTKGIEVYNARGIPVKVRHQDEAEAFFTGLDLIDPGVTLVNHWRPDPAAAKVDDAHVYMYGGAAVKPGR